MQKQAVVALISRGDAYLVIKRGPDVAMPGYWTPPSGSIEPGETQAEAVVREVKEEVGLNVRAIEKVWSCPSHDGAFELHWWTTELVGGVLRLDKNEVSAAQWTTPPDFEMLERTFEDDREFFRSVLPTLD